MDANYSDSCDNIDTTALQQRFNSQPLRWGIHFVCLAGGITITCRISFITPYRMRCYLNKDADVIWGYPKCEIMSIKPEEQ